MIKIRGGTTSSGESLCRSCKELWSRRLDNNQEVLVCNAPFDQPVTLTHPVRECNKYRDVALDKDDQFYKTAWILDVSKSGVPVGFLSNKTFRAKNPEDEDFKYR